MHHCNGHDAAWAMVQYGKECFCGYEDTVIDRLGSATCNYKCEGEPLQTCGGRNAFNAIRLCEFHLLCFIPSPIGSPEVSRSTI